MTVKEIIKEYLTKNGFDGLCSPEHECGCNIEDLVCCYGYCLDCEPAYEIEDKTGESSYIMTSKKP